MRNKLLCHTTALALSLLLNCIVQGQVQKIYLNPKAAGGESQSKFIDSLRFISLQKPDNVNIDESDNLTIAKSYFIIVQYLKKKLLFYKKDGTFVKQVSYKKLGNGFVDFYPFYNEKGNQITFTGQNKNYTLTQKDNIKIELDPDNPKNRKYYKKYVIDLNDTSFTLKKSTPTTNDISGISYLFDDDYYSQNKITTSNLYKDSIDYELKLYKNSTLIKQYFPYNHIKEPRYLYTTNYVSAPKSDNPHQRFVTRPYNDTIYVLTKDSISPAYQIILPLENTLPPYFFTTPFKNKTERENFQRNNGWLLNQIYNWIETRSHILFIVGFQSNSGNYIYSKKNKTIYDIRKIKADSSSFGIKVFPDYNTIYEDSLFYTLFSADAIRRDFKPNAAKATPKALENIIKTKSANEAVIAVFTLKAN
ncbi:MAG: hypothetical protein J7539_08630 [Niabella sp.]|nr:hypothetical protein [Niabella sp.]